MRGNLKERIESLCDTVVSGIEEVSVIENEHLTALDLITKIVVNLHKEFSAVDSIEDAADLTDISDEDLIKMFSKELKQSESKSVNKHVAVDIKPKKQYTNKGKSNDSK